MCQQQETENEITPPNPKSQRNLHQDIRIFINKSDGHVVSRNGRVESTECGTAAPAGNETTECATAEPVENVDREQNMRVGI